MKKYITEYELARWDSADTLVEQMNKREADGWRVSHHRLGGTGIESEKGWTIYMRSYNVMPDLNEALLPLRELWRIINSTEVFKAGSLPVLNSYSNPVAEEITKQVKEYHEKNAREMQ